MSNIYHAPPSVGSRLSGVVKPSYGKSKLKLEVNPLKLTGDSRGFGFNPLEIGEHSLTAKSPYRTTYGAKLMQLGLREIKRIDRAHRRAQDKHAKSMPKLVKIA